MKRLTLMLITVILAGCGCSTVVNGESADVANNTDTPKRTETLSENVAEDTQETKKEEVLPQNEFDGVLLTAQYENSTYTLKLPEDDVFFKIYRTKDDEETLVYDMAEETNIDVREGFTVYDKFCVQDRNGDGVEEVYVFFEDFFEEPYQLVLSYMPGAEGVNPYLTSTYFGYGGYCFTYEDIDEDGVKELISPCPSGGGMVTTWKGLDFVNEYVPEFQTYMFSYELTRLKYVNQNITLDRQMEVNISPEAWEALLESYADLGMTEKCREMIELGKELEELNLHPDWPGPYDSYFEFLLARSDYYADIWEELAENDLSMSDEGNEEDLFGPLREVDFNLTNGMYAYMPYSEFCEVTGYGDGLEFFSNDSGMSDEIATVEMGQIVAHFKWDFSKSSDPVLIGYVIKDPEILTARYAGIGATSEDIFLLYGECMTETSQEMIYSWETNTLTFDLDGSVVTQYKMTINE